MSKPAPHPKPTPPHGVPPKGYTSVGKAAAMIPADEPGSHITDRRLQQMFDDGTLPELWHNIPLRKQKENDKGYWYYTLGILQATILALKQKDRGSGKTISEAREDKLRKETEWIDMRLAERRSKLMLVTDHKRVMAAIIGATRAQCLALPARIGAIVETPVRPAVIKQATAIVHDALANLSKEDVTLDNVPKLKKRGRKKK